MVKIRNMKEQDLAKIAELERQSFSTPWSEESFREELQNQVATYLVAEIDATVCGYIGFWQILDEGHITNIAVLPAFRRQGIGASLLAALVKAARERSLTFLTLEVRKSNTAAIALYEKYGFRVIGARKRYYRDPEEDALIMTLYLQED